MTVAVAAFLQQNDTFGEPLAGGKVFTYAAGTLTPLASYTDQTGTLPNTNPVILDSAGRAQIWLTANVPYKLILTDAAGVEQETTDNFYAGASPEQLSIAGIVPSTGGTYTGPVNLNGGAVFGGSEAQDLATLDSLNIAGVQTNNLWINPTFSFLQRTADNYADGTYGFDRTVNLAQTAFTALSRLATPTDGIPYAMRITQANATAQRVGFCQIVEASDCVGYRGKNLAFALKVRCSAAVTVRAALVAWTGTLDSPTRDVVNTWTSTNYTAGNFFVANTSTIATAAVAASAGAWTDLVVTSASPGGVPVPTTMNNLYMVVWTEGTLAQNATLDASLVRCAQGTSAPLFSSPNTATEFARCQRYFYRLSAPSTGTPVGTGVYFSTTSVSMYHPLPVTMRATGTPTYLNTGAWSGLTGTGTINLGSITATGASSGSAVEFVFGAAASSTAGFAVLVRAGTIGNVLQVDAELGV